MKRKLLHFNWLPAAGGEDITVKREAIPWAPYSKPLNYKEVV